MAFGEFAYSFALFDAEGRLVDWDQGFEREWLFAAPMFRTGITYPEMVNAALSDEAATSFLRDNYGGVDTDSVIRERLATFGTDRSWEYITREGRNVRVDERRTAQGGIRRFAWDVSEERRARTALSEARQRLDAADSDTVSVFIETRRNPDGSYVFEPIGEALQRLIHLPPEMMGSDPMLFYSRMITTPEEDMRLAAEMERAAETLKICSFDYRVRDGADRVMWLRQSMLPRREPDGTIVFSGVIRDITREKEAEDEIEMLRSVVVRSTDSIAIFESKPGADRDSTVVYINQQFTRLFGWTAEEIVGRPIGTLTHSNLNLESAERIRAALLRNDGEPIELENRSRDGRLFWVEMRISTIQQFENGDFRWTVISRDISERRNTEMELLRAKEEAEAGNRAKSNFLANMSHELRTPLNAIIGFTELIQHGVGRTGWLPAYSEYLADVGASGHHLLELISTILDLSKIESGSLQLSIAPVEIRELVDASLSLVASLAKGGNVTVIADLPDGSPVIQGDFMKLKQVMLNILSNAIKFTPAGGKIAVQAQFTDKHAVIAVSDTGVGIAQADLERVTQPFFSGRNRPVAQVCRQRARPRHRPGVGQYAQRPAGNRQYRGQGHDGEDRPAALAD